VSSIPRKTKENPNPTQHVFSSSTDESSFEIFPDPRGNTLERGTEITLILKKDAVEFLDGEKLARLLYVSCVEGARNGFRADGSCGSNKHSAFASSFPIYLHKQVSKEVPDDDVPAEANIEEEAPVPSTSDDGEETDSDDSDEALVEEVPEEKTDPKEAPKKTKTVVVDEWAHLNAQPPLWQR
jgi:heat shock protein beta